MHDSFTPVSNVTQFPNSLLASVFTLTFILNSQLDQPVKMDALVATYSRPAFENEGYSSDEHQELIQAKPSLSLNFALPPMRNVSYPRALPCVVSLLTMTLSLQASSAR